MGYLGLALHALEGDEEYILRNEPYELVDEFAAGVGLV